jgi:glucose/arabinose dehydrogenase/cytochrome c553
MRQHAAPRPLAFALLLLTASALGLAAGHARAQGPSASPGAGAPALKPDSDDGDIKLPTGFRALVVADDLGPLRFLTVAANGDVYVKIRDGGIWALRDTDGDGRAESKHKFGSGGGSGIAIRGGWLYHSSNSAVYRYTLRPGELVPREDDEQLVVSGLPDGRQHNSKSFTFGPNGLLYVEVGSPSNAYGDPDRARGAKGRDATEFLSKHGGFWRFDADKLQQTQADGHHFSTGHRHIMAIDWNPVSKAFFVVQMGRDQLSTVAPEHYTDEDNAEKPSEEMHLLKEGSNLGWPYTYYDPIQKARMVAPEYGGDNTRRAEAGKYPDPLVAFPGHWAPMQLTFYSGRQFPETYRGGAFVTFHGSWNRAPRPQKGYQIAFVRFDEKGMPRGTYETFADGFAGTAEVLRPRDARFRPAGLAEGPDGSLYVSDSVKGRVWRIFYTGEGASPAPRAAPSPAAASARPSTAPPAPVAEPRPVEPPKAAADQGPGHKLYQIACATCHMPDGSGVPGLQPALVGSKIAAGPPATLVKLLLLGPEKALTPAQRSKVGNVMPAFDSLSDEDIAAIATYVRKAFAKGGTVTPAQVKAQRPQ